MVTGKPILSLDQGTTSSRAIVFGQDGHQTVGVEVAVFGEID